MRIRCRALIITQDCNRQVNEANSFDFSRVQGS